jgi:hypothetical protein
MSCSMLIDSGLRPSVDDATIPSGRGLILSDGVTGKKSFLLPSIRPLVGPSRSL